MGAAPVAFVTGGASGIGRATLFVDGGKSLGGLGL